MGIVRLHTQHLWKSTKTTRPQPNCCNHLTAQPGAECNNPERVLCVLQTRPPGSASRGIAQDSRSPRASQLTSSLIPDDSTAAANSVHRNRSHDPARGLGSDGAKKSSPRQGQGAARLFTRAWQHRVLALPRSRRLSPVLSLPTAAPGARGNGLPPAL